MSGMSRNPPYYHGVEQIRYLGSWAVTVIATVLLGTSAIAVSVVDRRGTITHPCGRLWARILLWITGIGVEVEGIERVDPRGTYVFAANHQSALDIPVLFAVLPVRFRMLAKASLFRIPFIGWYMRRVGYVPVGSRRRSVDLHAGRSGPGQSMVIFPEGTRTPEGELSRFRKGSVYLARDAGVPIVPVAIVNSGRLMARGSLWADPGVIRVVIGEPRSADTDGAPARVADSVRREVERLATAAGQP